MSELATRDILVNWIYKRGMYEECEMNWGSYQKLPQTLEELEELIIERLPEGGLLSEYAKVSQELNHAIGAKTYCEILCLYELCEGHFYMDVSEIDDVFYMENSGEWKPEEFLEKCMDIIAKCPARVDDKNILYHSQRLFLMGGKEKEVWRAYHNGFFPKKILEKLFEAMRKRQGYPKHRLAWIIAWMNQ